MKKLLTALMMSLPLASMAQGYTVTGHIGGMEDGDTIQIYEIGHGISKPFAETIVQNGLFVFKGSQADPRGVYIVRKNSYGSYRFILDNHDIRLTGKAQVSETGGARNYDYEVTTTGSELTDAFHRKMKVRDELDAHYKKYHDDFKDVQNALTKAGKDTAEIRRIKSGERYRAFSAAEKNFFETVNARYDSLYRANADSWWGPFLIEATMNYLTPDSKPLYEMLSEEARESHYGKMIRDEIFPESGRGKPVADFSLKDGKTLKGIAAGHPYIILDFWASWCAPCRAEIPNLKQLYELYSPKGLQIVSISIDRNKAAWEKACSEEKLPWLSYLDDGLIADLYKVQFVPAMFLIDRQGNLVQENIRGKALADKLNELFK
ncbi:MAG: AhpC/TSA family protein [Prevotella sp.]|nr:AhpC/TSA family protein [Prevotella sp.]